MNKWLRRLFYLPLLIQLRLDHKKLQAAFKKQQERLYMTVDLGAPEYLMNIEKKKTEELAERVYDLDARIVKLWNPA